MRKATFRGALLAGTALAVMLGGPVLAQECTQKLDQIEAQLGQADMSEQDRTDVKKMTEAARTLAETGNKDECMQVVADIEQFFKVGPGGAAGAAAGATQQAEGEQAPGERPAEGKQQAATGEPGGEEPAVGQQAEGKEMAEEPAVSEGQAQGKQQAAEGAQGQGERPAEGKQQAATGEPEGEDPAAGQQAEGKNMGEEKEGTTTEGEQPDGQRTAATPDNPIAKMRPQEVIGQNIVNANGETVGEISDLVIDKQNVVYAIVGVGGFLGIAEKDVAIPFDQLQLGGNNIIMMSEATEDQLQQQPAYEEGSYQDIPNDQPIGGAGTQ